MQKYQILVLKTKHNRPWKDKTLRWLSCNHSQIMIQSLRDHHLWGRQFLQLKPEAERDQWHQILKSWVSKKHLIFSQSNTPLQKVKKSKRRSRLLKRENLRLKYLRPLKLVILVKSLTEDQEILQKSLRLTKVQTVQTISKTSQLV